MPSDKYIVKKSDTHGTGVFAAKPIRKGTRILEYRGDVIRKDESARRQRRMTRLHKKDGSKPAVMIFSLTRTFDLDGNVPDNDAKFINHSCEPNCEAVQDGRRVFIHSLRAIKEGEELSFDYGFQWGAHEDHPCKCGAASCVGFILAKHHHHRILEKRV